MKQFIYASWYSWPPWETDLHRKQVYFWSAVWLFCMFLAISSRFRSLRGCCSIYLCFCTLHATLHQAHTRRPTGWGAVQEAGICLCGLSDLAKVVIGREKRGRGGTGCLWCLLVKGWNKWVNNRSCRCIIKGIHWCFHVWELALHSCDHSWKKDMKKKAGQGG